MLIKSFYRLSYKLEKSRFIVANTQTRSSWESLLEEPQGRYFIATLELLQKFEDILPFIWDSHQVTRVTQGFCVWQDLMHVVRAWRQVKGYPCRGQRTYSNAMTARKSRFLLMFRVDQFKRKFGAHKRNIYPTLVQAEYNNRLWYWTWTKEWREASFFMQKLSQHTPKQAPFDPVSLALGRVNGFTRRGKAAKMGKAKKSLKAFTIGIPLFFSRWVYIEKIEPTFPYILSIADNMRRQMGRKTKKNLR